MVNEEKECYNLYLTTTRSCINKPFKVRENFDGFEETDEYIQVRKLVRFFAQFRQIKPRLFFSAPFKLYKDLSYVPIKFYTTHKATTVYSTYMKQLQEESPDSDHNIQFIKNSLKFIGMFCYKNKISIEEYITYSGGSTYSWMKHIKEHDVSIYTMFYFTNLIDIIQTTPKDELELFLGNIVSNISEYKTRYDTSKNARRIIKEGFSRIGKAINRKGGI